MRFPKKVCIAALALCLMLSACKTDKDTSTNDQNKNTPQFYLQDGLRDIGEYKAHDKLSEADNLEFVPSSDYGDILYYIGDVTTYTAADTQNIPDSFFSTEEHIKFGLCTSNGTIIKSAIYDYVWQSPTGYLVLTHPNNESGEKSFEEYACTNTVTIIPRDGSWKLVLPSAPWESSWYTGSFNDDGTFSVYHQRPGGGADYHLYGSDGELINTIYGYDSLSDFNFGLSCAYSYKENGSSEYMFINNSGEVVHGPYKFASAFSKSGIACVKSSNGLYGLMNTDGVFVVRPEYTSKRVSFLYEDNDYRFILTKGGACDVYDSDGSLLSTVQTQDDNISIVGEGKKLAYRIHTSEQDSSLYRLANHTHIVCSHCDKPATDYVDTGAYFICTDQETGMSCLIDYNGRQLCQIENFMYTNWLDSERGLLLYVSKIDALSIDKTELILYDIKQGKELKRFGENCYAYITPDNKYMTVNCSVGDENTTYYLYNIETGEALFENSLGINCYKINGMTYFSVYTKGTSRIYDENFNVVLNLINDRNV